MGKAAASKKTTTSAANGASQYLAEFEAKQLFIGATLNLGWRLALTFLIPVALGAWLDRRYDTAPSYTITGLFLAIAGSIVVIKQTVKDVNALTNKPKRRKKNV